MLICFKHTLIPSQNICHILKVGLELVSAALARKNQKDRVEFPDNFKIINIDFSSKSRSCLVEAEKHRYKPSTAETITPLKSSSILDGLEMIQDQTLGALQRKYNISLLDNNINLNFYKALMYNS